MTRPFLLLTIVPAIAEYREIARGIMSAEWFVRQNDKVHGPFDAATVKQFAATNRIGVNTLIARSADGPWHPASKVKGLFPDALAPRTSTAPPPPVKVQAAMPVAAMQAAQAPAPSVPASHQKGYAAQTLEPGEATASETQPWSFEPPGWLLTLLLASPLLLGGLRGALKNNAEGMMIGFGGYGAISLLVLLHELLGRSKGTELSCPKCDTLTRRGGRPAWQIIVSILLFPIGLLALLAARKPTVCAHCGYRWMV